jgi:hypothetical protein
MFNGLRENKKKFRVLKNLSKMKNKPNGTRIVIYAFIYLNIYIFLKHEKNYIFTGVKK